MSSGGVDLVVDRLVVDGLELTPEQAADLARLTEAELRRELEDATGVRGEAGRRGADQPAATQGQPVPVPGHADLPRLARVLAERVAAELGGQP